MDKEVNTHGTLPRLSTRLIWAWIALTLAVCGCDREPPPDETAGGRPSPAITETGIIVAVGDSLTAGAGVAENEAYPAQLARRLWADGHPYTVVNAGVSGETSSGALARIDWVISSLEPDIIILETGANDGLRGLDPDLLKMNLDKIITIIKANNIQVVLAGMKMLPNLGPEYTRAFDTIYPQIARAHDVIFLPFFLAGVAGQAQLNQPDGIHPTAPGYTRIVDNVYPHVLAAMEKHRRPR